MEDTDRLLRESDIIRLTNERCGLDGVKFIEIIRDCPSATALNIRYGEKE